MATVRRILTVLLVLVASSTRVWAQDPLPSWNDGAAKKAIVEFVQTTTTQGSPKFVPPEERIATFDQDGTLWVEHPIYSQLMYCLDRVPALVKAKPELANVEPFKTVMSGDREAIAKLPRTDLEKIAVATLTRHVGRRFQRRGDEVDGRGQGSALEAALHGADLPADAGSAEVPARQRLQDLHRHGRRAGLRARRTRSGSTASRPSRWSARAGATKYGYDKNGRPFLTKEPKLAAERQQRRQGRGHPPDDRTPAPRRVRQHDRRSADARVHGGGRRRAADDAGSPRRREARVRLRPGDRACRTRRSARSPRRSTTRRRRRAGPSSA